MYTFTLRDFFVAHYLPVCLAESSRRNLEGYGRALDLWERLTFNPPLAEITAATLAGFRDGLGSLIVRGRSLSPNTIRKHCSHVQWILDQAGPPGPRQLRSAAGVLPVVPYARPPRPTRRDQPAATWQQIRAVWAVLDEARLPAIPGTAGPGAIWRALLATMCATGLRIGQLNAVPYAGLELAERRLRLPAGVCRKSRAEEVHPLTAAATAALVAVRTPRERLFPLWPPHAKTTIYLEWHRLQLAAGVEPFGFHAIRRRVLTDLSAISPAAAQLAAGHASYATTQLYQTREILAAAVESLPDCAGG